MSKRRAISMTSVNQAIKLALEILPKAYTPYSHHKVAAVLIGKSGKAYTGVNVENAAFSPTICAERTAFSKAVSEGERSFERIIVLGGLEGKEKNYLAPCGVCRQTMMEFCDPETFEVILAKDIGDYKTYLLKDILPLGFGPADFK